MSKFRRQLMMASMGEPVPPTPVLPYDAEVEYLETTKNGDYTVPLGLMADEGTDRIEIKFHVITTDAQARFVSSNNAACRIYANGSKVLSFHRAASDQWAPHTSLSVGSNVTFVFDISWKDKTYTINGTTKTFSAPNTPTVATEETTLYRINSSEKVANGRLYYFKYWRNDVLIRDMIPVRVGSIGYMYDKVSGHLFGNSGTASFTLGNDKN